MRRALLAAIAVLAAAPIAANAASPPPPASAWRSVDPDNTLVVDTNKGRIIAELYPLAAPAAVERLKTLARQHFYDGLTFFRVVEGFMDQTGDPQNSGAGGSTLGTLPPEFLFRYVPGQGGVSDVVHLEGADTAFLGALPLQTQPALAADINVDGKVQAFGLFCAGVVGMARANAPDSANSQFFFMREDQRNLDQNYTPVGRVIIGQDVVRSIKTGEPVLAPADSMTSVQVLADMPPATRPKVRVIDTGSAYFKELALKAHKADGETFDPCALPVAGKLG